MEAEPDWAAVLRRQSFLELDATERAEVLLDEGSMDILCGPFDRIESPWLARQDVTPQADDGVVIARGEIGGRPVVVVSIEQGFQGGAIGEVSGAKVSHALQLAAADCRAGSSTAAVLLLESGGVRLQEANLGLNAVAEICSAVLELRSLAPVVGVVAGRVGCFGGVSIAAGLCTELIVTREARIGLNGAAVIEQEAGIAEFDSDDRALIWAVTGGEQRRLTGLADQLVDDDVDALSEAVRAALVAGNREPGKNRSERLDVLTSRIALLDPTPPAPEHRASSEALAARASRGRSWLLALAQGKYASVIPSVLRADVDDSVFLAVVPDPGNRFYRAREGQVGLSECAALATTIRKVIDEDAGTDRRRAIVAVVDVPSQAYGLTEERAGLHQAIATAVDAYHSARTAGHPVVALVVGTALSGGFLAHGLQAAQILALDDAGVVVHAMHKAAAARITMRTVEQLDELAASVLPLSYDVRDWAKLGYCDGLLPVEDANAPSPADAETVRKAVSDAVERARTGPADLSNRLSSPEARAVRKASRLARDMLDNQWRAASTRA